MLLDAVAIPLPHLLLNFSHLPIYYIFFFSIALNNNNHSILIIIISIFLFIHFPYKMISSASSCWTDFLMLLLLFCCFNAVS